MGKGGRCDTSLSDSVNVSLAGLYNVNITGSALI